MGDQSALRLRRQRHDTNGQVIGLQHGTSNEPDTAVTGRQQDGSSTRQTVQPRAPQIDANDTGLLPVWIASFFPRLPNQLLTVRSVTRPA